MKYITSIILVLIFITLTGIVTAQEYPIATGSDNTFGGGGAFDGTNFLFAIQGDNQNQYSVTAQLVSSSGSLVGSRISLGQTGSSQMVAFDGTNFLMVWGDSFPIFGNSNLYQTGNIYGQFISNSGTLIGSSFTLVTGVNRKFGMGRGGITFHDTTYLLTYLQGGDHTDYLYAQRINKSGNLVGSPVQISLGYARECAVAYDGTNYLIAWCKVSHPQTDKDIYGQFLSKNGVLVGSNFLIDGSDNASDNPVTMTFDGTNYFVAFHEQADDTIGHWNLYARLVSTSGTILNKFMIADSSKSPTYATAVFDGVKYFATWMETSERMIVLGRYFTPDGTPIADPFIVFDTLGGKSPMGGVGGYLNGYYIVSATRFDRYFTDADIYIKFIEAFPNAVNDNNQILPDNYSLSQNYPNPFNPSTSINYQLISRSQVTLKIFNTIGQEVATLVNDIQEAGFKSITWDAGTLPTGIYYYKLQAGNFTETKKLILMK